MLGLFWITALKQTSLKNGLLGERVYIQFLHKIVFSSSLCYIVYIILWYICLELLILKMNSLK